MARRKRHSDAEISAKLAQADQLAKEGKTQARIARILNVSVMTFHRWRKSQAQHASPIPAISTTTGFNSGSDPPEPLDALQLENARLRRLVTDLLLEKVKLEEMLEHQTSRDH